MILIGFLLGIVILTLCLRRRSEGLRSAVLMGYNFLFVAAISFSLLYTPGLDPAGFVRVLMLSIYQAPMIMGFQMGLDGFAQLQYVIIFVIASIYTIRTVVQALFRRFFNDLRLRMRLWRKKEIFVIFGELSDAQALIQDIQRSCRHAAVLYLDPNPDSDDDLPITEALTTNWKHLQRLSPRREYHVVLLPEPNHENLSLLRRLEQLGQHLPNLHVTAFLDSNLLRLEDLDFTRLDAWLVSREQLLCQSHISGHLPIAWLKGQGCGREVDHVFVPNRPFSLCVVGFGPMSREFLLTTYENTAFETAGPGGRGLEALIVSPELPQCRGAFCRDFPAVARDPGLTWLDHGTQEEAFFQALEDRLGRLDQIFVDSGDTAQNINTALRLLRLCRRKAISPLPQLVVALHEDAPGSAELLSDVDCVTFLQDNRTQFTYEELVQRRADREARALHRRYQSNNGAAPDWQKLGTFLQASNRAVLWDIPNKLTLAGDLSGLSPEEKERLYWRLARYEHRRWNAFHFSRGWVTLPLEELTREEREQCKTKHAQERRHACLVDWDDLDALPQNKPGLLKFYDYENVVQLLERQQ